jgi:hypothetical protein
MATNIMTFANPPLPPNADLARRLVKRISERTGGQILGLEVIISETRVAVCGRARSYYHKQLAVQEIRKSVGPNLTIDLDLEVGRCP